MYNIHEKNLADKKQMNEKSFTDKKQWSKPKFITVTANEIKEHIEVSAKSWFGGGCLGVGR